MRRKDLLTQVHVVHAFSNLCSAAPETKQKGDAVLSVSPADHQASLSL